MIRAKDLDQFIGIEDDRDWLDAVRVRLYETWTMATGHGPRSRGRSWACEIYHGCRSCNEHLSVPCSLAREANEIGAFLGNQCYTDDPTQFARLYLILLSEFVGQLKDVAGLLEIRLAKPPKHLCMWANCWAKHRLRFLTLHHPIVLFEDDCGGDCSCAASENDLTYEDACGQRFPCYVIDSRWLESRGSRLPNIEEANRPQKAVIVVPSFDKFLDETIRYFRGFVDECLKYPENVKRFEASYRSCC
ncbi:MAG: hypothetical protein KY475_16610 [Planctomycetes bacterium]|nr:hypothetical protein [Planctomycetota bacterium]